MRVNSESGLRGGTVAALRQRPQLCALLLPRPQSHSDSPSVPSHRRSPSCCLQRQDAERFCLVLSRPLLALLALTETTALLFGAMARR